jgi:hypothetical protein
MKALLKDVLSSVSSSLKAPVCKTAVELDVRSQFIRTSEVGSSYQSTLFIFTDSFGSLLQLTGLPCVGFISAGQSNDRERTGHYSPRV